MADHFHVTSTRNRASITAHGLDWNLMGAAPGIAGSTEPEQAGVFLCSDAFTVDFFVRLNNTGGPVDVWAVAGVDEHQLVTSGSGFQYLPGRIPPEQLRLVRRDVSAGALAQRQSETVTRKRSSQHRHSRRRRGVA